MRSNRFPFWSANSVITEFFLRSDFIEGASALLNSLARVRNTASFQNLLNLAVLAKSSVQRNECQIHIWRQLEGLIPHIHSITSAPSERSAFEIPRPVASETSRSLLGPPIKTAIFLGKSFTPALPRFLLPSPIRCRALTSQSP